jgi:hypothetical protein
MELINLLNVHILNGSLVFTQSCSRCIYIYIYILPSSAFEIYTHDQVFNIRWKLVKMMDSFHFIINVQCTRT